MISNRTGLKYLPLDLLSAMSVTDRANRQGLKYTYIQTDEISSGTSSSQATVTVNATEDRDIQKIILTPDSYQTNDDFSLNWEIIVGGVFDQGGLTTDAIGSGADGGGAFVDGQDQLYLTGRFIKTNDTTNGIGESNTQMVQMDFFDDLVEWAENTGLELIGTESTGGEPKLNLWVFWNPIGETRAFVRQG